MRHRSYSELTAGLAEIERAPRERGVVELIVRRPVRGQREVLAVGELSVDEGLVGDRWGQGKRQRENQLAVMSSRVIALLALERERWPLAGDQLYIDLDFRADHLPAGTRVAIGAAEIEVSPEPHMGCRLFRERYGPDAERFVNSTVGRALQLRGINAWVVKGGEIRAGDAVAVLFE
ncbi:MAG TPA: MOSC domain-containing protein [Gammaproteobacteria bacterium]|nr:MOSC domain-containing protein [Gammaproteobacteria bacterium]